MTKRLLATLTLVVLRTACAAPDVTTDPEVYFLTESQSIDSLALLPPPPAGDSIDFLNDKAQYDAAKLLRDTPRGRQAWKDAHVAGDGVAEAFSAAFGHTISKEKTPEIYRLVMKMREDAGDLATRSAKRHYMRIRPFAYYNEPTCRSDEEATLSKNGSYPSGHTTIGWATALVLAEINPARQDTILRRGYDLGQSRVICGYHWQSDVTAARLVASAIVARLHANDGFAQQLQKAKEEFKKLPVASS
ncbi:acid phosphatase [Erwinia psidii]|uniref:Acid phosphatase n=1 Tax=Erwinia psidii TaxID=69224 RepID=A0A3N6S215_9GAMM|nr:phosphatase PAP2 family protein [Erwinia psidii]MCX8957524.1 phosphatase PAP2 family protein [Erwinia psidii]MCX8960578.1 phosphatase PAP2 family protein [Erwinia psidii]MCX8964177.1 phosphatase PAP2 family protein [Erwinia psidii]RQM39658.1 phosphatase PAP2 family protein [Erwinia psidii]